jgi:tRNA A-37 threonylcarbamoyl transferase component Bud32
MKVVINPQYSHLKSFIETIPCVFSTEGVSIYKDRNELKVFSVEGFDLVVKLYKKPYFINRIAYSFFRPSKAKRAYEYALKVLELGVETPAPIAFIEQHECGLLSHGYFISLYEKDNSDIRDLMNGTQKDEVLLKQLSAYIADLHSKGILHNDLSPGNVLYKKIGETFRFMLIDINRMQFVKSISNKQRFENFKRLSENEVVLTQMAKQYALAANLDESESSKKIISYSSAFFKARRRKYKDL